MYSIFHSTYLIFIYYIFDIKNAFYVKSKKMQVYSALTIASIFRLWHFILKNGMQQYFSLEDFET